MDSVSQTGEGVGGGGVWRGAGPGTWTGLWQRNWQRWAPVTLNWGSQNYSHRSSVLQIKFYWNIARAHHLHINCVITCVLGCFWTLQKVVEQCGLQSLRRVVAGSFQKKCADFWSRSRKVIVTAWGKEGGGEGRKRSGLRAGVFSMETREGLEEGTGMQPPPCITMWGSLLMWAEPQYNLPNWIIYIVFLGDFLDGEEKKTFLQSFRINSILTM